MLTPDAKPAFGQESLNGTATLFPCNQDGTTTPAPGLSRILTARVRDQETARGGGTWASSRAGGLPRRAGGACRGVRQRRPPPARSDDAAMKLARKLLFRSSTGVM